MTLKFLTTNKLDDLQKVPTPRDVMLMARKQEHWLNRTPVLEMSHESIDGNFSSSRKLYVKLETLQASGSFKIRGALAQLFKFSKDQLDSGVVAFGSQNYVRAMAEATKRLTVSMTAVVSANAMKKIELAESYPLASFIEASEPDMECVARTIANEKKAPLLSEKSDCNTYAIGVATIGYELLLQSRNFDVLVLPMKSGALAAGVASFVKQIRPDCRVYGVVAEEDGFLWRSLRSDLRSLSSSSGSNMDQLYTMCARRFVDEVIHVSEFDNQMTVRKIIDDWRLVVESNGALACTAVRTVLGARHKGDNIAVVLTGSNL
jgi:threonine dehydratase